MGNNTFGRERLSTHVTFYSPQTQIDRRRTPVKTETQSGVQGTGTWFKSLHCDRKILIGNRQGKNFPPASAITDSNWYKNHLRLLNVKFWIVFVELPKNCSCCCDSSANNMIYFDSLRFWQVDISHLLNTGGKEMKRILRGLQRFSLGDTECSINPWYTPYIHSPCWCGINCTVKQKTLVCG